MTEVEILKNIEKNYNIKFRRILNARTLFFDLAPQEASYTTNYNDKIIGLKIKGYDLEEIPAEIAVFKSLNILNLSNNNIEKTSLISNLWQITALNLSQNNIKNLDFLKNLAAIKWLNLQFNKIKSIKYLSKVKQISKLYLDNNNISSINVISKLKSLRELSAANNNIIDIEPVSKLLKLKSLDFSNNKIVDISPLRKLKKLEEINLSRNKIQEVPDNLELNDSVSLNISNNKITSKKTIQKLNYSGLNATGNPLLDVYIFTEPKEGVLNIDWLAEISSIIIKQLVNEKGSMLGIFGKWGRGKTFFWRVLREKLEKRNFDVIEFLAWKYHDTPASWAYLFEAFAKKYFKRPKKRFTLAWLRYAFKLLYTNIIREPIISIVRFVVGIVLPVILFFGLQTYLSDLQQQWEFFEKLSFFGIWVTYFVVVYYYFSKVYSLNMPNIFKRMASKNFENLMGMQSAIEKELIFLMKGWNKKVVLFVDDLDRCSEERILEVIDSLRIMTENEIISQKLTIIAAIDERILKRVIRNKYYQMVDKNDDKTLNTLTREYLDKLFLFGIKLSALNNQQKIEIFDNYTRSIQFLFGEIPKHKKEIYSISQIVTANDFYFLKKYLQKVTEITPRQIRIIYNKYLLAKEILKLKIKQEQLDENKKETLIALLMWFSFEKKIEDLESFAYFEKNNQKLISRTVFDKEFKHSTEQWNVFFDIIKQTVPY